MKIENTSDAAIYIPRTMEEAITVPRAIKETVTDSKTGDSRILTKYTQVDVPDEIIENLRKNNKVVAGYFTKKTLRVVGSGPPLDASAPGGKVK
jgi:hypothetical protein